MQLEGGFLAGVAIGFLPFGGVGQQALDAAHVLPHGSSNARLGLAIGQIVSGIALAVGGATGEIVGGAVSVSGIGALVGVPAMAVSATLVTGGVGNVLAGIYGATQVLMSSGSGSGGPPKVAGSGSGGAAQQGKRTFSKGDRAAGLDKAKDAQGVPRCEYCKKELDPKAGKPNSYEADHRNPYSKGGSSSPDNLAPTCRTCNRSKGAKDLEEWSP